MKKSLLLIAMLFSIWQVNAQNVGIGTTTPKNKLDVNGSLNLAADSSLNIGGRRILSNGGNGNLFIGDSTGYFNNNASVSFGIENTFVGRNAGKLNTDGATNIFIGSYAGYANTTGFSNSFLGASCGRVNSTGYLNTFIGGNSGRVSATGNGNTFLGFYSGGRNSTGDSNTFVGLNSGFLITIGKHNVCIGNGADVNGNNYVNGTSLGSGSIITASNVVRIGNSSITSIGGFQNFTNVSDSRFKTNVSDNVKGLEFILKLHPVTYKLDVNAINKFLGVKNYSDNSDALNLVHSGFLAQDVEQAAKEVGYDFSGVDKPKNEKDHYGLRYAEFTVPLVKAVQELALENRQLKAQLQKNMDDIAALKQQMLEIKNAANASAGK